MKIYRDDDRYVLATGKSPRGYPYLEVTWEGDSPDNVREQLRSKDELTALQAVENEQCPNDWWLALGVSGLLDEDVAIVMDTIENTPRQHLADYMARINHKADEAQAPTSKEQLDVITFLVLGSMIVTIIVFMALLFV